MPLRLIRFYYDIGSPYSYLAFELWTRYQRQWSSAVAHVDFTPCLIGGVFKLSGNSAPSAHPEKGRWVFKDFVAQARLFNIDVRPQVPTNFPMNTLFIMRVLTAIKHTHPDSLIPASRAFYRAYWLDGTDLSEPSAVAACLTKALPSKLNEDTIKHLIVTAESPPIKQQLLDVTKHVVDKYRAFGLPLTVIHSSADQHSPVEHVIFGSDRFELMAMFLEQPYPGDSRRSKL